MIPNELNEVLLSLRSQLECDDEPCVYFLIKGNTVSYVGQSKNARRRLAHHNKRFEAALFLPTPADKLDEVERYWIQKLLPSDNKQGTQPDSKSLTLWLSPAVIEGINQLIILRGTEKRIPTKSEVVANLVNKALRKAQLRKDRL